jgi:hypothetical protein
MFPLERAASGNAATTKSALQLLTRDEVAVCSETRLVMGVQADWKEENKQAIADYNARIEREGLPLAKYRRFMKGR